MATIDWTEKRIKAFEDARDKGMNHYILKQGILRAAPLYFVGMAFFAGFAVDWRPSALVFVLPVLAVGSLLFGYIFTRLVWQKYDRSYRAFLASRDQKA